MSTFEIVRGVEGDCLVLDGTRICGPKPWGGGRIIDTFRTDGVYEVIDKDEYRRLMADNAKLLELVEDMHAALQAFCDAQDVHGDNCPLWVERTDDCELRGIERRMSELRVGVDE